MAVSSDPRGPGTRTDGVRTTETVDPRTGTVHVAGPLTVPAADLVRGTVESLHRGGHTCVRVDLRAVPETDPAAAAILLETRRRLAASGARLVVYAAPACAPLFAPGLPEAEQGR